jgi:hypothetical protein
MSKGAVIYAYNSTFDYVKSAEFAAKQVKKYLGIPVTLITDTDTGPDVFDTVINKPNKSPAATRSIVTSGSEQLRFEWKNQNRASAYDLSPYDQTLLIDADYFMFNDSLKCLFDSDFEFSCSEDIVDVASHITTPVRVSSISMQMCWATVVYFTKCKFSESVFSFMETIRNNWQYYSMLYNFNSDLFRNDYALSIALHALSGFDRHRTRLPIKLHTIFTSIEILDVRDDEVVFATHSGINKIKGTNLHVMNKIDLEKFYAGNR